MDSYYDTGSGLLVASDFKLNRREYEYSYPSQTISDETFRILRTIASFNGVETLDYQAPNNLPLIIGLSIGIPAIAIIIVILIRRRRKLVNKNDEEPMK